MARIARSDKPLYQTHGRPVSWPVALTNPDGSPLSLVGATAEASLRWNGVTRPLTLTPLDATGRFVISGVASLTQDLPLGDKSKLVLSITDSLGDATDYVWPVVGEDL